MDRDMAVEHLALAERHVIQGARIVAHQIALIGELKRGGRDTGAAENLLAQFEATQAMYLADRDRIKKELAQIDR